MTFPNAIQRDRGEPAKIRIGTVNSALQVVLQGTVLEDVGFISSYTPISGDTVAIAGQSAVGSSGSSWLVLGAIRDASTSGLVTVSMFRGSGQFIPSHTLEEVEFTLEFYNTGEYAWDGFADITLPYDGIYLFVFNMAFVPELTGAGVRYCEILISGNSRARHRHPGIPDDYADVGVTYEGECTAGDIVNFRVYQTLGSDLQMDHAEATIRYIGRL